MQDRQIETIQCVVENIVYKKGPNDFAVIDVSYEGDMVTAVGILGSLYEGEQLELSGRFITHPTYGDQFKVDYYHRKAPETASAIRKYLSSGAVKGIGKVTADRIVTRFSEQALDVIMTEPERLVEIRGISKSKAQDISKEIKAIFGLRELTTYLGSFNIPTRIAIAAFTKWESHTLELIKDNPYMLCSDDVGLPFEVADEINYKLGFEADEQNRVVAGIIFVLKENLLKGHTCLPIEKLVAAAAGVLNLHPEQISSELSDMIDYGQVVSTRVKDREFIFLSYIHNTQTYIVDRLHEMRNKTKKLSSEASEIIKNQEQENSINYDKLQRAAIEHAVRQEIMVLTGGPGTGKTTTVNGIIDILESLGGRVLLCAPTGRSAKRLCDVTGREAKTIHRLLEFEPGGFSQGSFRRNERNPLKADAVVVDEMSMVDVSIFEALLKAIPAGCKLILVGDKNQLPPVGAGNVLGDILGSGCFNVVELKTIFRQAAQSKIVTNAHAIVNGDMPELGYVDNDFFFINHSGDFDISQTAAQVAAFRLTKTYNLSPQSDIQIICPSKQGTTGTKNMNLLMQDLLNPAEKGKNEATFGGVTYRVNDKVMQIKNNYHLEWKQGGEHGAGIFNGDIGVIKSIDRRVGFMVIDFDGRVCDYPIMLLYELELAYAVTVHKSQGCEFEAVVMPISKRGGRLYFRNLLYTAVTRAKKLLVIVGDPQGIEMMVENDRKTLRYTILKTMLRGKD